MAELVASGTWVEIYSIVLAPDQRASHIPEDTKRVPLEMRVKGFLVTAAALGDQVEIVTVIGRRLHGTLVDVNPAYAHGFGPPIRELQAIGGEVRALLRAPGANKPGISPAGY
jgi:2-amino-4-ketopentanoate thiolase alpha subunit